MGQARHLLSLLLVGVALAVMPAGCGSSDETTERSSGGGSGATSTAPQGAAAQTCAGSIGGVSELRASGVGCGTARGIVSSWDDKRACGSPAGASRTSCSVEDYRCLGVAADRGLAVSCGAPGRSISFIAKRG